MLDTLEHLESKYGGVIGYMDHIGFTEVWQDRLRIALSPKTQRAVRAGAATAEPAVLEPAPAAPSIPEISVDEPAAATGLDRWV